MFFWALNITPRTEKSGFYYRHRFHTSYAKTPYPKVLSARSLKALKEAVIDDKLGISHKTMYPRRNSRERSNSHKKSTQGEHGPISDQQHPGTDRSSSAPPTRRRVADHPNRKWRFIQPDSSYTHPEDPSYGNIILPWQVSSVTHASADRVDEVIDQLKNKNKLPAPQQRVYGLRVHPQQSRNDSSTPRGKSASTLVDRESGMSLDGFPSRSIEEGGVSGLDNASDSAVSAGTPSSSSPSLGSADSSGSTMNDSLLHSARAVTMRPFKLGRPGDEGPGEHRTPSPAGLDRVDELLESAERMWTDLPLGSVAQTRTSEGNEHRELTGDREMTITPPDQDPGTRGEGQRGPAPFYGSYYTQENLSFHQMGHAEGSSAGVNRFQPPRVSPTPSESSIVETVFNVRLPTPPPNSPAALPRRPDTESLPSSQRHAVAAAARSGGLRRGGSYPASDVGLEKDDDDDEEDAVPAALVPGGRLSLGESRDLPPQVSRRPGRGGSDVEERRQRRDARKE